MATVTAYTATPLPTYDIPAPSTATTTVAPEPIPAATLTRQVVEAYMATQLTLHPRVTATSDVLPPSQTRNAANRAAAQVAAQTRMAGWATAMHIQATQSAATGTPSPVGTSLTIPEGAAPQLDGRIESGEWADATGLVIDFEDRQQVEVQIKQDGTHLFVAYTGLNGNHKLFPELLLDPDNDRSMAMNEDDWWFHVSTTTCWGHGRDAVWQTCGAPEGWRASGRQPETGTVEMTIPYATIGLAPGSTEPVGIAFAVLEVAETGREVRWFWPEMARVDQPNTWASMTMAGR